ncbi:hypothetical protein ACHAXA_002978 [Cyclostephanos tholiformis]|uniref:Uncharacterized protein n=1 Tax=Cyclostephanos tholiformis TaxID=382380 RepID=A0ABD3SCB7_9STRA
MVLIVLNRRSSASSDIVPAVAFRSSSSSADIIRNRLLFKLGIYDPAFTSASIRHKIQRDIRSAMNNKFLPGPKQQPCLPLRGEGQELPQDRQMRSILYDEAHHPVSLTISGDYHHLPHLLSTSDLSSLSSYSSLTGESAFDPPRRNQGIASKGMTNKRRPVCIRFDPSVTIIPIPSHRSYDHRTRAQMYATKDEISFDVVRNTREFVYEGWDWRNVIEEAGMYFCTTSREFVHPVHVDYRNKNTIIAKYHLKFAGFTTSHPAPRAVKDNHPTSDSIRP